MTHSNYRITEGSAGKVAHFDNAPYWIYEVDNPYLHGAYAPTTNKVVDFRKEIPAR